MDSVSNRFASITKYNPYRHIYASKIQQNSKDNTENIKKDRQ